MSDADEVVAKIKQAIQKISGNDYSAHGVDAPLDLDSVVRISLIVELENAFQMELNTEAMMPEDYLLQEIRTP